MYHSLDYCIMCDLPVSLPLLIFNNITADNFEHRNLPYDIVLTIFFEFWRVDLSKELFIAPPRPFDHSLITRLMSHLSTCAQVDQPVEEEDIPEPEPHPASPPPIPPTVLYFTLLTSVNLLTLSHT